MSAAAMGTIFRVRDVEFSAPFVLTKTAASVPSVNKLKNNNPSQNVQFTDDLTTLTGKSTENARLSEVAALKTIL